MTINQDLRETVRKRYASDALLVLDGGPSGVRFADVVGMAIGIR
jgi:hypothetical protein